MISQLPLSLGGFHSSATLKPHTSIIFRASGGPGRSTEGENYSVISFEVSSTKTTEWQEVTSYSDIPVSTHSRLSPCVQSCLPTICRLTHAVSSTFSICTWRSYFPECILSVLRMKRIVSKSLFLTLANVGFRGSPSLLHVTFGLGFPCVTRPEKRLFPLQNVFYKVQMNKINLLTTTLIISLKYVGYYRCHMWT